MRSAKLFERGSRFIHVEGADAFAVAFGLDGVAEFFAHGFHAGDGGDGDGGRAGVGAQQREVAEAEEAQEEGLVHHVILHAVELELVQAAVKDAAVDAQALGREFVAGGAIREPAERCPDERHDEADGGKSRREGNADQRGEGDDGAGEVGPEMHPLRGVAFPE